MVAHSIHVARGGHWRPLADPAWFLVGTLPVAYNLVRMLPADTREQTENEADTEVEAGSIAKAAAGSSLALRRFGRSFSYHVFLP